MGGPEKRIAALAIAAAARSAAGKGRGGAPARSAVRCDLVMTERGAGPARRDAPRQRAGSRRAARGRRPRRLTAREPAREHASRRARSRNDPGPPRREVTMPPVLLSLLLAASGAAGL